MSFRLRVGRLLTLNHQLSPVCLSALLVVSNFCAAECDDLMTELPQHCSIDTWVFYIKTVLAVCHFVTLCFKTALQVIALQSVLYTDVRAIYVRPYESHVLYVFMLCVCV